MESTDKINLTETKNSDSRKHIRSEVDLGTLIELNIQSDDFQSSDVLRGIVFDSSFGGCGLILVNRNINLIPENTICYLRIPEESNIAIKAKVVWIKEIHNNIFRYGLEYMEEYEQYTDL